MAKKATGFPIEFREPKNKVKTRLVKEFIDVCQLKDILKVAHLAKATYYYWIGVMDLINPNEDLEVLIKAIFDDNNGRYGCRRIRLELKNRGFKVNHKKITRIMIKLGLDCSKFRHKNRKYRSYKGTVGKLAPNRIHRKFYTNFFYQKLTTDISEFKTVTAEKLYLNPIMDMATGEILTFSIGNSPNLDFVMKALTDVLPIIKDAKYRTTIHSDQGWHYQHKLWVKTLKDNQIFQSMSRKGNCLDNSPMENFFGLLKQEMYYGEKRKPFKQLKGEIEEYIIYYNNIRIKEKLAGMSPVQYRIHASQIAA
jgi:transposase InsO family protein